MTPIQSTLALLLSALLVACAATTQGGARPKRVPAIRSPVVQAPLAPASGAPVHLAAPIDPIQLLDRVTWGANDSTARALAAVGAERYLGEQLAATDRAPLPREIQTQIDAMTISQRKVEDLARDMETRRREIDAIADDEAKKSAQQAYQQEANRLAREAMTRAVLRAVYSPAQLQEQMTWFWMNHFNVHAQKLNLRVLVGDYEERAIRPYALGRFRDLLGTTLRHPAMLLYLDNARNAAGQLNENYARELLELHTLGVDGGYTQHDVQELARVLTGVGVVPLARERELEARGLAGDGLFLFIPRRHDFGDKVVLGRTIKGRGVAEVDEVLDMLSRHPSTARFVSRKLAQYFVSDAPSSALVDAMAQTFLRSDGDIAATLRTMFASQEFANSLGRKFKDPVHYVVSAIRLAYDERQILNAAPMLAWLNRLGEPLYGHQTPDGYPLDQAAWSSPGQMTLRFDVARAVGAGAFALFRADDAASPVSRIDPVRFDPALRPQLANAVFRDSLERRLGAGTRAALDQARSPQEWNGFLLASPEFMMR